MEMTGQEVSMWITLGIAALLVLVAILHFLAARQYSRAIHNRAAFDLFDERFDIYQQLHDVAGMVRAGQVDREMFIKAAEALERAQFLFGKEVVAYVKHFTELVSNLECVASEIKRTQGAEMKANLAEQRRIKDEVQGFFVDGTALFSAYIRFDQKIS
jgi:hypothetical protein